MQRACVCACLRVLRCSLLLPDSQPVPPSDAGGESSSFPLLSSLALTRFRFSRVAERGAVTQQSITLVWSRPALFAQHWEEKGATVWICHFAREGGVLFCQGAPLHYYSTQRSWNDIVWCSRHRQELTVLQTCTSTCICNLIPCL